MPRKIGKSHQRRRVHVVEGRSDATGSLQDRIQSQVKAVQTTIAVSNTKNELDSIPVLAHLPKLAFEWYGHAVEDKNDDEARCQTVLEIMHVLSMTELDLESHSILEMYLNILSILLPGLKGKIENTLKSYSYAIGNTTWEERKAELRLDNDTFDDLNEVNFDTYSLYAAVGIYFVLIGKQFSSNNYSAWIQGRARTFTQSCGIAESEDFTKMLLPDSKNCGLIYTTISSKWELRRTIFLFIKALSKGDGIVAAMAKASMVILHGAELGNFNLTNKYIVVENPILLCWSELAKYSPHLIAAIDKYQSLGEDGPYCKLLYHSSELPEFNRNSLKIFATIAREIAILEGVESFKNYAGTSNNSSIKMVSDKAILLIKSFGGANTHVTDDVRKHLLVEGKDNKCLVDDLAFGAHIEMKNIELSEDDDEEQNVAL